MKRRRVLSVLITTSVASVLLFLAIVDSAQKLDRYEASSSAPAVVNIEGIHTKLAKLEVKGRAPKTGYSRDQFGGGWAKIQGCSTRDIILYRDLTNVVLDDECRVTSGVLHDPYTGETISFSNHTASEVQIDHVVALSDAWQKGAQQLSVEERKQLANDPLELLAVEGAANQTKGDGDAATWLPKNKAFRCEYIERQVDVKIKYALWVTEAEKQAMERVLATC
ncbi:TPA: calcium-binding protein [Candidatus Saccharibacteria bacterium]|nr:calcium-binding protein [Candidatus Saccharibacteria bacterium]